MEQHHQASPPNDPESQLKRARREVGLSQDELWQRYFALGGTAAPGEFEAYVDGDVIPVPHEYDVLVHALNERSMELGSSHRWAYSADE